MTDQFYNESQTTSMMTMSTQSNMVPPVSNINKKKKGYKGWMTAAAIAMCLVSGAAGSGFTAMMGVNASNRISSANTANSIAAITNGTSNMEVINTSTESRTILSVSEISAKISPAVVSIEVTAATNDQFGRTSEASGSGSGIIITENGYVLTNNHVIDGASSIKVMLAAGKEYSATLVGTDSQTDLAVLKIDDTNLPFATLGDSDNIQVGDLAVAIGNPLGELANTVTTGIISATDRELTIEDEALNLLQTDAAINPGNSGGALCNQYGEVIGVVNAKTSATGVEGLGFAIPVNDAKPIIEQLIENGYVSGRASLGISTQEITSETAAFFRSEAGVYVAALTTGGAAEQAGVESGDLIMSLDGETIDSVAALKAVKEKHSPGDSLELVINRNGQTMTLTITLQEEK